MGIVRFEIELDNPSRTYDDGSILSGKVYLDLDSSIPSKGLKVTVYGRSKIYFKWGSKQRIRRKEIHLNEYEYALGSDDASEVLIPEGSHVYPFSFELTKGIPYTYADSIGTVKYRVRATIRRSWYLRNHRTSTEFTVVVPLDLNFDCWNAAEEVVKNSEELMGCSGPVYTTVSLPVRGYIPGQTMPIMVVIKNEAQVHMKEVYIGLIKVNLYHGTYARTKTVESLLAEHETRLPESSDMETTIECNLYVPATQPSSLMYYSSIMDIKYLIRVRVEGLHFGFNVDVPVIIGSTALLPSTVPMAQGDGQYGWAV